MEKLVTLCECRSLEHIAIFEYDEVDKTLYLSVHLASYKGFWKRLLYGIKYIFGYKSKFGAWDEMIISESGYSRIKEFLEDVKSQPTSNGVTDALEALLNYDLQEASEVNK